MFNGPPQPTTQQFLELTIAGSNKKLYMPTSSVLTYEEVPEGKNEHFPDRGSFIRYDYGEGLAFAIVKQTMDILEQQIGAEGFLVLKLIDEAPLYVRKHLVVALQEQEDEGVSATKISLMLGGQVGSLYVTDDFESIKAQG